MPNPCHNCEVEGCHRYTTTRGPKDKRHETSLASQSPEMRAIPETQDAKQRQLTAETQQGDHYDCILIDTKSRAVVTVYAEFGKGVVSSCPTPAQNESKICACGGEKGGQKTRDNHDDDQTTYCRNLLSIEWLRPPTAPMRWNGLAQFVSCSLPVRPRGVIIHAAFRTNPSLGETHQAVCAMNASVLRIADFDGHHMTPELDLTLMLGRQYSEVESLDVQNREGFSKEPAASRANATSFPLRRRRSARAGSLISRRSSSYWSFRPL